MEILQDTIKTYSLEILEQIKSYRRAIHSNPELSFKEIQTAKLISSILRENHIKVHEGIGVTGLIGVIEGKHPGKTIGIRAELDALPIIENTNLEFSSTKNGIMHACGHDIHMASLIGTALILNKVKDKLNGKVLLIFEPGEEQIPGGAISIIKSDIFKSNQPDTMLTFHVLPELTTGMVGFCEGRYMASGDEVYITVKGKGGHAALPETYINPLIISSHLLINLQDFIIKETPADIPSVLSFGKIQGNGATNIIPNEVYLEGTFRTMDEAWRTKVHEFIDMIAKRTCQEFGGSCEIEIRKGYPSVFNDPKLTALSRKFAEDYLGVEQVISLEKRMTTDDFAYFSQIIPSVFFRMGVGFNDIKSSQLHSPSFIVNEDVLKHSYGLMTWIILKTLSN